ncbi:hypothetical protein HDV00_004190 [Rhizophlyctis rosea]|nr:hypothetical protein HDV00_004190 [Rhizophlyctis rosea]
MSAYEPLVGLPSNFTADRVKMICCDIDGTTLDANHSITAYTLDTFEEIRKLRPDLSIIFATGRSRVSAAPLKSALAELGHSVGVYLNGSLCGFEDADSTHDMPGFTPFREAPLLAANAAWYLKWAIDNNRPIVVYNYDRILTPHDCPTFEITQAGHVHEPYPQKWSGGDLLCAVESGKLVAHKLSFMSPTEDLDRTRIDLDAIPSRPAQTVLVRTEPLRLEVMQEGATKATAIRALAETLVRCSMDEVIAFGDGENDVEMIGEVGMGVAMGNGKASVKAVAKFVAPSNAADGLARTLEAIFGIKP